MPRADETDAATLHAFLRGDARAHRTIEAWVREIVRFRGFSTGPDDREDLVQDAMVRLWRVGSQEGFRIEVSLRAYVRRVAGSVCIDHLRRRKPTEELPVDLASSTPSPYDRMLDDDRHAQLYWALQHLGERCRMLIQAHFFEQRPYAVIAAELGRSESTLRVHVFHCIRQARRLLHRWERS